MSPQSHLSSIPQKEGHKSMGTGGLPLITEQTPDLQLWWLKGIEIGILKS